ncbi:zinc-dependent alcohol dehydrogenase family protein [Paenibacillus filicis]|uniref:Zinc-dependent alcohol dehydrogenase family protein n=1 Tax=Paenibacillus gyeongsangnamensis TaxID=3388067 RepID=A0ABT4QEV0_9BACL|nr:zinc-dependent alcohol dehydrogenase family protein [Paenibacillus filicis]MCZ8515387.1 zinc-dependent alcohol dehydrogenase family protein [Paenibacillus filicis]
MESKCVAFYQFGKPQDVLRVEGKMHSPLKQGEVRVRMTAAPINPSDLIPITGAYAHRISLPAIPGYEGVGIVEEVGPKVSKDLIGKRVLPLRGEGTWQQYVSTQAQWTIPIPGTMDDYTAAQLYINPVTAWILCTEVLSLKPDDILLVNACGSSIGRIAAQLSKLLGFRMIAVTRNHTYTDELLNLGASQVINTAEERLHSAVMELTNGAGATAAIDSIGGSSGTELASCVKSGGLFITIGLLSGIPVNWAHIAQTTKVHANLFYLRHWNERVSIRTWQQTFGHLIGLISEKRLSLMPPQCEYPLTSVQEAVRTAQSGSGNRGKVFLTMSGARQR